MRKLTNAQRELLRQEAIKELARREYWRYCHYTHEGRWIAGRHLIYTCNEIQRFVEEETGHSYDILIFQMPPQHGKSMSTTETLPSWYLGKYPTRRVILASYNDETAERFTRRNKEKIKQFGKALFDIEISKALDRATEFELTNNVGRMISRGIMGGITSNPANLILIDDPVKNRQEADSETFRERMWEEWQNTIKTRLAAGAKVIIIMTRWHEDDLAGRIIQYEKNVKVINLPCEAETNDPLDRKPGEALFPEIGKDDKWLQEFKQGYQTGEGKRAWLALFQGRPTAEEGNMVKRSWWKYYKALPEIVQKIISVDATFKDGTKNDFVAIQTWGKTKANMYLIDRVKARMDFPTTVQAIRQMKAKHKDVRAVYVEDKANGSAIISVLRTEIGGVIPVEPYGSKEARVSAVSPQIEAGNVYLPEDAPWVHDFVEEWSAFPNGKNDDEVDAGSQAINKLMYYNAEAKEPNKRLDDFLYRDQQDTYELDPSYITMGRK